MLLLKDLKVFKMKSDSFKELHNLYLALFLLFVLIVSPTTVLQAFFNAAISDYSPFPKCFHIHIFLFVNPAPRMLPSTPLLLPLPFTKSTYSKSCPFLIAQLKSHFLLQTSLDFTSHKSSPLCTSIGLCNSTFTTVLCTYLLLYPD